MANVNCINLRHRFGKRWRVGIDESYKAETGSNKNANTDPWNWKLLGSHGHIYPHGGEMLGVAIDGHRTICLRLKAEPWVVETQHGDDGINAIFHVDDIEKAAEYAKLYKRRSSVVSEAFKEASKESMARIQELRRAKSQEIDPVSRPDGPGVDLDAGGNLE